MTATAAALSAPDTGCRLADLQAEFPGWRIWASRPRGLLWATRLGNLHYHDGPRLPGWAMTVGDAQTLCQLRALLAQQRALDTGTGPPGPPPAL